MANLPVPAWVFAGIGSIRSLAELAVLKEQLEDDELLMDVHAAFIASGMYSPAYRTLCNALQKSLGYTSCTPPAERRGKKKGPRVAQSPPPELLTRAARVR